MRFHRFYILILALLFCWNCSVQGGVQTNETFDSSTAWGTLPWGGYSNKTSLTGWSVTNAWILSDGTAPSQPYACQLPASTSPALIISPSNSYGVGSVLFYARNLSAGPTNRVIVESSSGNGIWTVPVSYTHLTLPTKRIV